MKKRSIALLVGGSIAICLLLSTSTSSAAKAKPPAGFKALFNGKDLKGWWGLTTEDPAKWQALAPDKLKEKRKKSIEDIKQHWTVVDGVLVNDGHGLYLSTEKNYKNFELLVDYKTVLKADSGIYLRGIPQVQIWDSTDDSEQAVKLGKPKGSGGLWNNGAAGTPGRDPLVLADNPLGEWNSFRIKMIGDKVTVHLNGKLVVDNARLANFWGDRKLPMEERAPIIESGPIQLQTHGGEISWRNIYIREIKDGQ